MQNRKVLFSGNDMILVLCGEPDGQDLCVTFSPLRPGTQAQTHDTGFGEGFLAKRGVPALHFIARANHWWNTPEMAPCLALAAPLATGARRRVGYGSSMGGYGALRFAAALGLDAILAFAPQFSVDPAKVPWEWRWRDDRRLITRFDEDYAVPPACQTFVVYDPDSADARHVALIAARAALHHIQMPGAGHFVLKKLRDDGVLESLVLAAISGSADAAALSAMVAGVKTP